MRLPLDNRCAHLRAVPLQPMFLLMPTDLWRCRDCVAAYAANPLQLTDVEENTCDICTIRRLRIERHQPSASHRHSQL
ncbi:hypothetical protein GCM10010515_07520 [Streptomyces fructofermentans]|uniref:Uncharacterized protein n=2 Tax=Streptomyces TaxID=1883 RepID=A0A918K1Q2_9ACTN|nr:hypothetical protein GCM10010515_07520 [Streptomyces fructofermentans]